MIGGLVEKLVGSQVIEKPEVVVEKKSLLETNKDTQTTKTSNNNILYRKIENGKWVWINEGNKKLHNTYKGELKNNLPEGYGVELNIGGGKIYEGNWKGGEKHGKGTINFGSGNNFVGEFKDNQKNGQGTFTWYNGAGSVGEWKDGKMWNGTDYDKNGKVSRKYVNGVTSKVNLRDLSTQ